MLFQPLPKEWHLSTQVICCTFISLQVALVELEVHIYYVIDNTQKPGIYVQYSPDSENKDGF